MAKCLVRRKNTRGILFISVVSCVDIVHRFCVLFDTYFRYVKIVSHRRIIKHRCIALFAVE